MSRSCLASSNSVMNDLIFSSSSVTLHENVHQFLIARYEVYYYPGQLNYRYDWIETVSGEDSEPKCGQFVIEYRGCVYNYSLILGSSFSLA